MCRRLQRAPTEIQSDSHRTAKQHNLQQTPLEIPTRKHTQMQHNLLPPSSHMLRMPKNTTVASHLTAFSSTAHLTHVLMNRGGERVEKSTHNWHSLSVTWMCAVQLHIWNDVEGHSLHDGKPSVNACSQCLPVSKHDIVQWRFC